MNWAVLSLGMLLGWAVELVIDYLFWGNNNRRLSQDKALLEDQLKSASAKENRLMAHLQQYKGIENALFMKETEVRELWQKLEQQEKELIRLRPFGGEKAARAKPIISETSSAEAVKERKPSILSKITSAPQKAWTRSKTWVQPANVWSGVKKGGQKTGRGAVWTAKKGWQLVKSGFHKTNQLVLGLLKKTG